MKGAPSLLPEPRGFLGTAVWIGALTALPFGLGWSWLCAAMQGIPFGRVLPFGLGAGALVGLFFGLTMGFLFRGVTADVDFADRKGFVARLNVVTSQLGYHLAMQTE